MTALFDLLWICRISSSEMPLKQIFAVVVPVDVNEDSDHFPFAIPSEFSF